MQQVPCMWFLWALSEMVPKEEKRCFRANGFLPTQKIENTPPPDKTSSCHLACPSRSDAQWWLCVHCSPSVTVAPGGVRLCAEVPVLGKPLSAAYPNQHLLRDASSPPELTRRLSCSLLTSAFLFLLLFIAVISPEFQLFLFLSLVFLPQYYLSPMKTGVVLPGAKGPGAQGCKG